MSAVTCIIVEARVWFTYLQVLMGDYMTAGKTSSDRHDVGGNCMQVLRLNDLDEWVWKWMGWRGWL